jgi:surface protein
LGNLDTGSLLAFAGPGNAFVKTWYDQSGNGRHASQATAANQPQIVSNGIAITDGLKNAILWDDTGGDNLQFNRLTNIRSIFHVSKLSLNNTSAWFLGDSSTYDYHNGGTVWLSNQYISAYVRDGINKINGTVVNLTTTLKNTNRNLISLIHTTSSGIASTISQDRGNTTQSWRGYISEILLYSTDQTSNRTFIENEINSYYNIFGNVNLSTNINPNLIGLNNSFLTTNQSFPGFSYGQGNLTLIFTGQPQSSTTFINQGDNIAITATTSSVGYGSLNNNSGRTFPTTGLNHVSLRFTTGSVDCFINGIPTAPNSIFPSASIVNFNNLTIPNYSGSLGNLLVYNRELSDNEIYAIYSQQARKYGLIEQDKPYTTDSSVYAYTQAAGITGSSIITALDAFVVGLKANNLWNKMIAIYPFLGSDTTKTRYNLKDPSLNTTQINYSGSWSSSLSGSYNNNTSSYGIMRNIKGDYFHPLISSQSIHLSYLSYDTPVSGGYLMGVEQLPGLPGDIATPAAAYSVRKVRTAYTGSAMRIRRDLDNATFDVGFDAFGNLNTSSLFNQMTGSANTPTLPGNYSGLAAAYSLRKVSSSYSGYAVEVRRSSDDYTSSIGFDDFGNFNTSSLLAFISTGSTVPITSYSGLAAAYSLRRLTQSYAGYAIEIQSGSVSQSIGFNSFGDIDTIAIRTFAGSGDAFVKTWYDQSGNNRHASQSNASLQPQIYSGSARSVMYSGDKPSIYWRPTGNDTLRFNELSNIQSIFHISQLSAPPYGSTFILGHDSVYDYHGERNVWLSSVYALDEIKNGSNFINGVSKNLVTTLKDSNRNLITLIHTAPVGRAQQITQDRNGNFGSNSWQGYIQELLIFTSSQAANRTYIENNINSYYGIYTPTSVSTENAFVKTWYDQSGNNRHATQTTSSRQPLIVASGTLIIQNGKPAINFRRVNSNNLTLPVDSYTMASDFAVLNQSGSIGNYDTYIAIDTLSNQVRLATGPFPFDWIDHTPADTRYQDGRLRIGGPGYSDIRNQHVYSAHTSSAFSFTRLRFGGRLNTTQDYVNANIQEYLFFSTDQTTNKGLIEDNINSYYNIFTQSLASGSGYVTTWYDQSGNNNHAVQVTASLQPLILSSGSILYTNGKPSPKFDGVDDRLISPVINITQPYTAFTTTLALGVDGTIYDGSYQTTSRSFIRNKQSGGDQIWATNFVTSPNVGGSIQKIIYGLFNGSNSQIATNNSSITTGNVGTYGLGTIHIGGIEFTPMNGYIQEISIYSGNQSSNRAPIQQNINTYFNIYTPLPYNTGTNSLSLFSSPTLVAGAANASPTGLTTGGPEGLITVSRTGSGDYTLWKNRVPTKTSLPASVPQSQSIYLNAANVSNALFSGSQNNVSYASVGAGLTDNEVYTYYELVDNLQTNLGRSKSTNPNAFITTWDTRISGTGTVTGTSSIALPLFGTQAITASWGDGTVSLISSSAQVDRTHSYVTPGVYTVSITGTGQGFQFNNGGDRNKLLDIGQWGSISGSIDYMFYGCSNLVGTAADIPTFGTTNIAYMFHTSTFKGYVNHWNTSNITNLEGVFYRANSFNQDIGNWDISKVTSLNGMFYQNSAFTNNNSPSINNWNTSNVTNMSGMFNTCPFNQPINDWNVSKVINFSLMHYRSGFNQPLDKWRFSTSSNIDMGLMFVQNPFNQNIGAWNVEKVTNMSTMFFGSPFNNSGSNSINNWRPISCSNFSGMFQSATSFNQPIGNWPLSASSINMSTMFQSANSFNQNIGAWNVEKVTNMSSMFQNNGGFNNSGSSDINNWRPISCSNFSGMFQSAGAFNQPIGNWTLGTGSQIPVGGINMTNMFASANNFNRNIGLWDVSAVTSMERMFQTNTAFNNSGSSDINNWNVSRVTNFLAMFDAASSFNQPLGNWNTISASRMDYMFKASPFNQPIGNWNVSNVILMDYMFENNSAFNQDIGSWNVSKVTGFTNFMAGKTAANYSFLHTIYDGWINYKLQPQRTITFNTVKYSGSAAEGRALLVRAYNTASITGYSNDGGFMAITCSANHSVIVGNKVFISGSSFSGVNGVQTVLVAGSPTTLTLNTIYDPTATGGTAITGYGWSITDGGVV